MEDSLLLNQIGFLWMLHKNYYYSKLHKNYIYGINCKKYENNLLIASYMIEEIENYYNDCSCLKEEEICNLIVIVQKILI